MSNRFDKRPLSYSQISSFEYSPEQWYNNYILGIKEPPNPEMLAGTRIGDLIGTDTCPIGLQNTGIKEYELRGDIDGIKLVGFCDIYHPENKVLHENKTSPNQTRWNQKKADEHGQLTMYALMLRQQGVEPEEITMHLNFVPLRLVGIDYQVNGHTQFTTTRTAKQVDDYTEHIKRIVELMHQYTESRPLSTPKPVPPVFKGV